jgi:2-aminoethylphosphonate-pyruvate transaminase
MKLFCPGPVNISDSIKKTITNEISHRGQQFQCLFNKSTELTSSLFSITEEYRSLFLTGSGTLAVESIIYSYLKKKKTLLLQNGLFSEKWEGLLKNHGCSYKIQNYGWCNPYDYDLLESQLVAGGIDCIFIVHHETSTTMINDLYKINEICTQYGVEIIVDAVSSAGIYDINFNNLKQISFLGFSTNKGIGSFPGLAVVIGKVSLLEKMTNEISYLNLKNYYDFSLKKETPYTPCVQNFYYYNEAVSNILEEENNRLKYYENLSRYLIEQLATIKIYPILKSNQCCWVLNFFVSNPNNLYDRLLEKNITVYKCKDYLEQIAIQIGILNKTKNDIDDLINSIISVVIPDTSKTT